MTAYNLDRIARGVTEQIIDELDRVGMLYRIFYRCKSENSLAIKFSNKGYNVTDYLLQDLIGIRINVYFVDDLNIIRQRVVKIFNKVGESVDELNSTEFRPVRLNYVFSLPDSYIQEFNDIVRDARIDKTFELQIRTVLSEGWHEVDHDLRYKHSTHWRNHTDLDRVFNGILASLETNDWSMLSIFEQLSYRHYKAKHWDAMIRTKMRMRLDSTCSLNENLVELMNNNIDVAKDFFKLSRSKILSKMLESGVRYPLNIDNVVFFINHCYLHNKVISEITPGPITKQLDQLTEH